MVRGQSQGTVQTTPLFWRVTLRLMGWKTEGTPPDEPKQVLVVAPHTSNWDFFVGFAASRVLGIKDPRWVGKASLFRWPLNYLSRPLGGIPVNRGKLTRFVDQVVEMFSVRDELIIAIAPEGKRRQVTYWKSGFYYIAAGAQVPITLISMDFARKVVSMGPTFMPTGDIEADFVIIRDFYAPIQGKYPGSQGEVRLRPRDTPVDSAETSDR